MNKKKIRIGLIGLGKMGQKHLRALSYLKNVEVIFVYDVSETVMQESADRYGIDYAVDLYESMKKVDAVVIVTPTSTHCDCIKMASRYVDNIFIEKPLTGDIDLCKEVLAVANEKDMKMQVGFIERFNPAVMKMKELLDSFGGIISVDFTRSDKQSSRITDADVVADLMVHDIDMAIFFNGDVVKVSASGVLENKMISYATAILEHANGRISRVVASRITEKKIRKVEATCRDVFIECDLLKKEILLNKQSIEQKGKQHRVISMVESIEVAGDDALVSEISAFVSMVSKKKDKNGKNAADVKSTMKVIAVADEIQKQIYKNKKL